MAQEKTDDICGIEFCSITLGEHNCNINRIPDKDFYILTDFMEATPHYSEEHGPHIIINVNKKLSKTVIIPLSKLVSSGMLIENGKNMTDSEYLKKFVELKKNFIEEYLIKRTFMKGFELPSSVQALTIPELIQRDILVFSGRR